MIKRSTKSTKDKGLYADCEDAFVKTLQTEQESAINSMEALKHIMEVCDIQIARFMKLIYNAQQAPGGLVVTGTSEKKEETQGTQRGVESDFCENQTVTNTMASYELILRYNNEIEKAKHEKLRCLELLLKISPQGAEAVDDGFIGAMSLAVKETWENVTTSDLDKDDLEGD